MSASKGLTTFPVIIALALFLYAPSSGISQVLTPETALPETAKVEAAPAGDGSGAAGPRDTVAPLPAGAPEAGISLEVPGFGPVRFVLIEAGPFMMGSSNQRTEGGDEEDDDEAAATVEAAATADVPEAATDDEEDATTAGATTDNDPADEDGEGVAEAGSEGLPEGSDDPDSEEDEIWRGVTISHDYYIAATEVTQGLYKFIAGENPSCFRWSGPEHPVEQVSWVNAIRFCNTLSRRMGMEECYNEKTGYCDFTKRGFRLPTEAEWEKAAKAGTLTIFDFGDDNTALKEYAVVSSLNTSSTAKVGTRKPSKAGLYDIYGNVWEWCQDLYLFENHTLPPTDPCWQGPDAPSGVAGQSGQVGRAKAEEFDIEEEEESRMRVIRGGGWGSVYYDCRPANRGRGVPTGNFNDVGFRIMFPR